MLEVVIAAVRDPACDVAKMQALLDMQERLEDRDAKKAFTVAFNALQAKLPTISRDGKIDHGEGLTKKGNAKLKTRYATYPNIMEVVGPLLKQHGFTLSNSVEPFGSGMAVVGCLEHIAGHSKTTRFPLTVDASGGKNNQQGWGSSQQYGMRYNAIALLNIVSRDPRDADNDGHPAPEENPNITEDQFKRIMRECDELDVDKAAFCDLLGVPSIREIPAAQFDQAMKQLDRKRKALSRKRAAAAQGEAHG